MDAMQSVESGSQTVNTVAGVGSPPFLRTVIVQIDQCRNLLRNLGSQLLAPIYRWNSLRPELLRMNSFDMSSPSRRRVVVGVLLSIFFAVSVLALSLYQYGETVTSGELFTTLTKGKVVTSPVTIVTAYFPLKKSKHSSEDYRKWMENFIGQVESPLVVYTIPEKVGMLSKMRGSRPVKFLTDWTPFTIPPLKGVQKVYTEYQNKIDPEKNIHGPELYATWNGKPWFAANAARRNYYNSEFFFWVDVGSWRRPTNFRAWPHVPFVRQLFSRQPKSILLGGIYKIPSLQDMQATKVTDEAAKHYEFIEGTFFGGGIEAVQWWEEEYYRAHDTDLVQGRFVGKDQHLMDKVAALNYWRIQMIVTYDRGRCNWDPWFYYQPFLASNEELPAGCENRTVWRTWNPSETITNSAGVHP